MMRNTSGLRSYRQGDLEARRGLRVWAHVQRVRKAAGKEGLGIQGSYILASEMAEAVSLDRLGDREVCYPKSRKLSVYRVMLAGHDLGTVGREVTSSHRKAGRIIMRTWHPLRWRYDHPRVFHAGSSFMTRKGAIEALCYQWVIEEV